MKNKYFSLVAIIACLAFSSSLVALAGEKGAAKTDAKASKSCCMDASKTASADGTTCSDGTKCDMKAHKASTTSKMTKHTKTMASKTKKASPNVAAATRVNN